MERCKLCQKDDTCVVLGKYGYCTSCEQTLRTDITVLKQKLNELNEFSQTYLTRSERETALVELDQTYCALREYKNMHLPFFTSDIETLRIEISNSLGDTPHTNTQSSKGGEFAMKSEHLEIMAVAVLVVGLLIGLLAGGIFQITVQEEYIKGYFHPVEKFNAYIAILMWVSTAFTALMLWFCSTMLFHLEKNRNFNKKAIELLEKIANQQTTSTMSDLSQQPAEVSTTE